MIDYGYAPGDIYPARGVEEEAHRLRLVAQNKTEQLAESDVGHGRSWVGRSEQISVGAGYQT